MARKRDRKRCEQAVKDVPPPAPSIGIKSCGKPEQRSPDDFPAGRFLVDAFQKKPGRQQRKENAVGIRIRVSAHRSGKNGRDNEQHGRREKAADIPAKLSSKEKGRKNREEDHQDIEIGGRL